MMNGITLQSIIENNNSIIDKLFEYGILKSAEDSCRDFNIGDSNYAKHIIQPWAIWQDWNLNPWDADIIKRTLRTKGSDSRILDYQKIIHICNERIRQLNYEKKESGNKED